MNREYTEESELESEEVSSIGSLSNGSIANLGEQAAGAYDETKTAIRDAYKRTSEAVQSGYKCTLEYGAEHPQRFGLATFAIGLGAGTLLAATAFASRHTKTERIAAPVIDAVAEVARAVLRR
jgi:ElaB/YqjD/DUF883 family membrane-anchored ribosome-binding protein